MMKKVDIHTHIIPFVDDGAKSVEMSGMMIKMLKKQGFTDVCLTPHYDPLKESIHHFINKRNTNFEKIKHFFDEEEITPHLGAEVKFYRNLFTKEKLDMLCVDGKDKILIEMPFEYVEPNELADMIYKFASDMSFTPIIVHPERYKTLFYEDFLIEINNAGCLVQSDIEELKSLIKRSKIKKLMDKDLIHILGSDCHDLKKRSPDFERIKKYFKPEEFDCLMKNALCVIE